MKDLSLTIANDGRGIDPALGILSGEGSQQVVLSDRRLKPHAPGMLQEPVWIWSIPTYFYVGGVCGTAATLAATAQVLDGRKLRDLVTACRWIAAVTGVLSGGLLIHDLGRPSRFLNMLRVFRPTSPMSVGSWVLTFCAGPAGGAALFGRTWVGDLAALTSGLFGMPLASYTGVLIANTAIPVWQEGRRMLPILFIASGAASTASLLELVHLRHPSERVAQRFGKAAGIAELAAIHALQLEVSRVAEVGKALTDGLPGLLWTGAKVFSTATLLVNLFGGRSRRKKVASAVLGTAASICIRFAVFQAGKASARNNEASFALQRAALAADKYLETGPTSPVSK